MKKISWIFSSVMIIVLLSNSGCIHNNRADLVTLLSPSSLPYLDHSKLIQVSSYDTTGGNNDRISIPAGKSATILNAEGPGMITRIWFTMDSRDPYFLRRVVMRIFWDGEDEPSVEVPIGDFFGNGLRYTPFVSQFLGMTSGGYVCYFPMPFERLARIEISNESNFDLLAFYYQINFHKFEAALGNEVAYFHAQWRRSTRTDFDSNFQVLYAEGHGHIVGMNMTAQSHEGNLGFLEGDEMIYVDGEKKPSIQGTGTEDYFSSGWYFNHGEYSGPLHGLVYKNDTLGIIAAYRLHIPDQIPFRKSVKFTMEHGHDNESVVDIATTVFWYQTEPHLPFPKLPVSGQRIPLRYVKPAGMIESESVKFDLNGLNANVQDMSDQGSDWTRNTQYLIESKSGSVFSLTFSGLDEPVYNLSLYYTRGPSYGNIEVSAENHVYGTLSGYAQNLLPDGKLVLPAIPNRDGSIVLTFRNIGKDNDSQGFETGIDGFTLEPVRKFISDWYILGPFPNRRLSESQRLGIDSLYPPELGIEMNKDFTGADGKLISWQYVQTPSSGYISLLKHVKPEELVVTYALTYIWSPDVRKVPLFIGTDDGAKVFFNNYLIYRYLGVRVAEPDQVKLELNMKPGWNKLLLKVENNLGGYGFYARLLDRSDSLKVSAKQKLGE